MGIRHVGERGAEILAEHFSTIDRLMTASEQDLAQLPDVGPKVAESIYRFFRLPDNVKLINRLRTLKLPLAGVARPLEVPRQDLAGQTFVLTGTLDRMSREEATGMIKQRGGRVTSSVSRRTSIVVQGRDSRIEIGQSPRAGISDR